MLLWFFTFQTPNQFIVSLVQSLCKLRRGLPSNGVDRVHIGVISLEQPPPRPTHRVEPGTIGELEIRVVARQRRVVRLLP
jgi:hypothetical protein